MSEWRTSHRVATLEVRNAVLSERVRQLTKLLDDQVGTPCEQVRHAEEKAELVRVLEALCATSQSADLRFHREWSEARAAVAKAKGKTWDDLPGSQDDPDDDPGARAVIAKAKGET